MPFGIPGQNRPNIQKESTISGENGISEKSSCNRFLLFAQRVTDVSFFAGIRYPLRGESMRRSNRIPSESGPMEGEKNDNALFLSMYSLLF